MFIRFFIELRAAGLSLGIRELLHLQEALAKDVVLKEYNAFYYLCRCLFVKREQDLDTFDRIFAATLGQSALDAIDPAAIIPDAWLEKGLDTALLQDYDKQQGILHQLEQRLQELLQNQRERHEGGKIWVGTGGQSPFGAHGQHQQGVKLRLHEMGKGTAAKVWEQRQFKEFDESKLLENRQFQLALRKLRLLKRQGVHQEFDVAETIRKTCQQGGIIKETYRPSRQNGLRLLLLLDVGGSMDTHVHLCQKLFSAARHEFRQLDYFYFHNCLYEKVWRTSQRRRLDYLATETLFQSYSAQHRIIVVGDASMAPYELEHAGGSIEHVNAEPGRLWLHRLRQHFPKSIWLNPVPEQEWSYSETSLAIKSLFDQRMYPLSLQGLEKAVKALK